jgi:preprotein translocase subunit SecE
MGRLKKKKDPSKKKAQRVSKTLDSGGTSNAATAASAPKATPIIKKSAPPAKAKSGPREPNVFQKSIQFLREVKIELKKVTWPSRKQTMGSTIVVLVLWMIISMFLGMVDFSLSSLMRVVLP